MKNAAYEVKTIANSEDVDRVYAFAVSVLGDMNHTNHTLAFYRRQAIDTPSLLIYAEQDGKVIGCILGSVDGDHVLVGPVAVAGEKRRLGIGFAMMQRIEEEARKLGQDTLILGALQEAEGFYIRCGFRPNLFIQYPETGQVERLKRINQKYPVIWEAEEGKWTRLMLSTTQVDRELQAAYEEAFPGCYTQYVFIKEIV